MIPSLLAKRKVWSFSPTLAEVTVSDQEPVAECIARIVDHGASCALLRGFVW